MQSKRDLVGIFDSHGYGRTGMATAPELLPRIFDGHGTVTGRRPHGYPRPVPGVFFHLHTYICTYTVSQEHLSRFNR